MRLCDVCVIGAGPYGLTAAAHLRAAGADVRIFGNVMSFWRSMPTGMLLRSSREAISLSDPSQSLSLDDFERFQSTPLTNPVARADFVRYGEWFQQHAVPRVDNRMVDRVTRSGDNFRLRLSDGDVVHTKRVIVATGLESFTNRLPVFDRMSRQRVSHSIDHRDSEQFADRQVLIVGSGQSALEAAALLSEAGAHVELIARKGQIHWLGQTQAEPAERGLLDHVLYPPGAIGPPGVNWIVSHPGLYKALPRSARGPIFRRAVRPAGSDWIRSRFTDVTTTFDRSVVAAKEVGDQIQLRLCDGTERQVDHVIQGTGFTIRVDRIPFLDRDLLTAIRTFSGQPYLRSGYESSVPGLHFIGAASEQSYGPMMRAIVGTGYAAREVTRSIVADLVRAEAMPWVRRTAPLEQSFGLSRVPAIVSSSPAAAAGIAFVAQTLTGDPIIFPHDK